MTNNIEVLPGLVAEGLDYFDKAGDEGDKQYISAIRQHIAARDAEIERLREALREAQPFIGWTGSYPELHAKIDTLLREQENDDA